MMQFNQHISEKDYKRAILLHYFGYKYTYITPVLGAFVFVTMTLNLIFTHEIDQGKIIAILLSLFLMARPFLYVQNIIRSIRLQKNAFSFTTIKFTDNGEIEIRVDDNYSSIRLKDLIAYTSKKNFLFLYVARNQFILIDKTKLSDDEFARVVDILKDLGVNKR
jgi:hypothetical protein